jgi:hypothetical protein
MEPRFVEVGSPTKEELELIVHYLRLFVPWALYTEGAA